MPTGPSGLTWVRATLGTAAAAAALLGLAWASAAPMSTHRAPDAQLRLAWSARPERIETCRPQTDEERAALPRHMQQQLVCEGTTAGYRLQVRINGALVSDHVVHGGGLRRDRRLYVFEELPVAAGEAAVDVRFDRLDQDQPQSGSEAQGQTIRAAGTAVPPRLRLAERFVFSPREVVLVTYDPERLALVVRRGDHASSASTTVP